MKNKPTIAQVVAVLEILARFHPAGFGLLLGQVCEPEAAEIAAIIAAISERSYLGVRIAGGREIPEAERIVVLGEVFFSIIEAIGGWEHVYRMTREVMREVSPSLWQESADYAMHIAQGGKIRDGCGGMGKRFFNTSGEGKHEINERTARRRFRNLMRVIALKILSFPVDGNFELQASTEGGFPR
ncbi:MAG: hypothetical protein LBU13_06885 [Synergistaceae bacterium]|jgi:hypothetical protein|nr:hypothetical protein [Synergistaceae bacterium]